MRFAILCMALLVSQTVTAEEKPANREECRFQADYADMQLYDAKEAAASIAKPLILAPTDEISEEASAAIASLEASRIDLVAGYSIFIQRLEDVAYQLRLCSRATP
jgi:hypothetical protein